MRRPIPLLAVFAVLAVLLSTAGTARADVPSSQRVDLLGAGLATFGTAYVQPSMVEAALAALWAGCDLGAGKCQRSASGVEMVLVPVAGPAMIARHESDVRNQAFLYSLSGTQAAGLAVAGYALATRGTSAEAGSVTLVPYAVPGGGGATVSGQF
jgi:hypothetical protein